MSTQSNAVNELPMAGRTMARASISQGRLLYWSVRREVWENRSIYLAPAAVAGFLIVGLLIAVARGVLHVGFEMTTGSGEHAGGVVNAYQIASGAIMAVALIVSWFYCLSTLQGERRDRSILFWKSLPVSDTTSVVAKAAIPFVVIPVVMTALVIATHLIILLILSIGFSATGQGAATAWPNPGLPQVWLTSVYHLVTIHVLWYAPLYCYMLMVSAWSKRAPFLWAVVPPVLAGVVEKIAFNTTYVFSILRDRFTGESSGALGAGGRTSMESMQTIDPLHFFASPGLWIGLAVAVGFLVVTVRLRRSGSAL
jgi:ABC-2 type transport system permease protein